MTLTMMTMMSGENDYRIISERIDLARSVWQSEQAMPRWFRLSSDIWTPTFDEFADLWQNCGEIWGWFGADGELIACIYIEFYTPETVNLHISVLHRHADTRALSQFCIWLRDRKAADGVMMFTGWVLRQNRGLMSLLRDVDFHPNGLVMGAGSIAGRLLQWQQVCYCAK